MVYFATRCHKTVFIYGYLLNYGKYHLVLFHAAFTGLSLTRIQYTDILQSMPDNYLTTWNMLWDYLDAECIDAVLDSIDARIANRLMLDCLIQRHTEDISGFCDILEWIPNTTYELSSIVEFLRGGMAVCWDICMKL